MLLQMVCLSLSKYILQRPWSSTGTYVRDVAQLC